MKLTKKLLSELQKRLKIGNRRGVHLNAIPGNSRYKFDLTRLSFIDKNLPQNFITSLLTQLPLKFRISWKNNVPDLNSLFEEDQAQLVKITKAFENLINQTEAIESEKGINTFGFGFPVLVRKDKADNKLTVAPLLIWSLRIKRTKEFNTWEINRNEDDPIYLNEVLTNHLLNDSKIELEPIPNEILDDGLLTKEELLDICANVIKAVNSSVPSDLKEILEQKIDKIISIGDKDYYEKLPLNSTNAFIDFGGLFSIFEVQKQNIINDYSELMELKGLSINMNELKNHYFQPISSVETDPSQQSILHSLSTTRNVLIQGPPGTGKSQSLTAILLNALENHKKTVVVCEKRTALEVLHNALMEKNLSNHCILIRDIVKDRKAVVDSVRGRVDDSNYRRYTYTYSKETLDKKIKKIKDLISVINNGHKKLDEKIIGGESWTKVVGNLLSELKGEGKNVDLGLDKNHFNFSNEELNNLLDVLEKGQKLYDKYKPHTSKSFINSQKLSGANPYHIEEKIRDSFDNYEKSLSKIRNLENVYRKEYLKIRNSELAQQLDQSQSIQKAIIDTFSSYRDDQDFLDEQKTDTLIYKTIALFSKRKKTILMGQSQIKKLFMDLDKHFYQSKDLLEFILQKSIRENLQLIKSINQSNEELKSGFANKIENEYANLNIISIESPEYTTKELIGIKKEAKNLQEKIVSDNWIAKTIQFDVFNDFLCDLSNVIEKKHNYFNDGTDVFPIEFGWFSYFNSLSNKNKALINKLKAKKNWRKSFLVYYLNTLLTKFASTELPTNDNEHAELLVELQGVEKEQLKYINHYWYSKQIDKTREFEINNSSVSVENLYNKRSSYRFKRLSLRQIVQYDTDLFTTFFPIILTSPDVCSNLFRGMNGYFDIVLFDEASQLRLEDNLPAVLKGKQVVIAGDEHQMPPSNYFSKVFDGTIDDEDEVEEEEAIKIDKDNLLASCESLLEFGEELGFEKRYLDFHYRSRHPHLIDFSNHAFYKKRLKPSPNNFDYSPIKYIQVDGTFSDHMNEAEAEMVLSILENNINRLPDGKYPTVGIATFNIAQRNLIKSKLLERQRFAKYAEFNAKIQELEENGMFVKNLENIQGDERDVIILSTTYGVGKDGKFAQRFGPINHSKGYKLLNVIITRAKYKVYVCSSVPEQVFMNYRDFLVTEGNNKRAVFYAYLAYSKAVSESNEDSRNAVLTALNENITEPALDFALYAEAESPFEEEVFQALAEKLDPKKLHLQFPFAGFRIDILYDPKLKNVPKVAIECDGAKYHSSEEAYLYDLHRQKILEKHGIVFHRIWSTNWWRNSKRETERLVEFIKEVEARNFKLKDQSKTALAFTDDIAPVSVNLSKTEPKIRRKESATIKAIDNQIVEKVADPNSIGLDSKVKVRYINSGKDIKVHLVEQATKLEMANGIQKIHIKSPLGESLVGHRVGDIVKVGNLDNFVEVLEVKQ